jgi:hypothetical protein
MVGTQPYKFGVAQSSTITMRECVCEYLEILRKVLLDRTLLRESRLAGSLFFCPHLHFDVMIRNAFSSPSWVIKIAVYGPCAENSDSHFFRISYHNPNR